MVDLCEIVKLNKILFFSHNTVIIQRGHVDDRAVCVKLGFSWHSVALNGTNGSLFGPAALSVGQRLRKTTLTKTTLRRRDSKAGFLEKLFSTHFLEYYKALLDFQTYASFGSDCKSYPWVTDKHHSPHQVSDDPRSCPPSSRRKKKIRHPTPYGENWHGRHQIQH